MPLCFTISTFSFNFRRTDRNNGGQLNENSNTRNTLRNANCVFRLNERTHLPNEIQPTRSHRSRSTLGGDDHDEDWEYEEWEQGWDPQDNGWENASWPKVDADGDVMETDDAETSKFYLENVIQFVLVYENVPRSQVKANRQPDRNDVDNWWLEAK